jgi:glycosyltransferase involved in cell wall biosynthesis
MTKFSLILPAKNEAAALEKLLPELVTRYPTAEIIIVSDGSSDNTAELVAQHHCRLVEHIYSKGNGAAIKTGARAASGDILVFMDADGQHKPEDIQRLLDKLDEGHDMVVGARSRISQAGIHRATANGLYNQLASWMVGHKIADLTSGFRAVRADKFRQFLYLLPNGFSYPTTITMSFFRAGYSVAYIPIEAPKRIGKSHIRLFKDGMRFLLIIFKIGTLYSPLKLFTPISAVFFATGLGYYLYTFLTIHRFTNMSAMLFITGMFVFLMGLISEQITTLMYKESDR